MKCIKPHKKKLTLASRLPSYKPLSILFRIVLISLTAIGLLHFIVWVIETPIQTQEPIPLKIYLVFIFSYLLLAEFQIALDNTLERVLPIPEKVRLRVVIQIVLGLIVLFINFKLIMQFLDMEAMSQEVRPGIFMGVLTGLLFVSALSHALIIMRFTEKWGDSQKQISTMKKEKLEMAYNSLQDQINPHFLFNNLSVLKYLIIYDKDSAVKFTEDFTDVYRYVLQSKNKKLVNYSDEAAFIDSYIALHKERLGDGLQVQHTATKNSTEKKIAPLTLQLLVENAIKHNIAACDSPLVLSIIANEEFVSVENNLQIRETPYSTKTGLDNLLKRYELLSDNKIRIESDTEKFVVRIPLL